MTPNVMSVPPDVVPAAVVDPAMVDPAVMVAGVVDLDRASRRRQGRGRRKRRRSGQMIRRRRRGRQRRLSVDGHRRAEGQQEKRGGQ